MTIIRPRLNDFHNIPLQQEDVDFAIPFLDEDIPFYVDPFLLWKSPSQQDNSLHIMMLNALNYLGVMINRGEQQQVQDILIRLSECNEVGLGVSKSRIGNPIGGKLAQSILSLFTDIPQIREVKSEIFCKNRKA